MTVVQQQPQPTPSSNTNGTSAVSPASGTSGGSTTTAAHPTNSSMPQQPVNPSCSTAASSMNGQGSVPTASSTSGNHVKCHPGSQSKKPTATAVFSHPLSPNHSSGSDTDPVLTTAAAAATALRRLYFKNGRSCRPKGPTVPMVIKSFLPRHSSI